MKPLDPEIRAQIIELSGGMCEWPGCTSPGTEIAHLHSRGSGGTPDGRRDDPSGLMCACWLHARYTDGEQGDRSAGVYYDAHHQLLGPQTRHHVTTPARLAYARAEALRAHLERKRSWAALPPPT